MDESMVSGMALTLRERNSFTWFTSAFNPVYARLAVDLCRWYGGGVSAAIAFVVAGDGGTAAAVVLAVVVVAVTTYPLHTAAVVVGNLRECCRVGVRRNQ